MITFHVVSKIQQYSLKREFDSYTIFQWSIKQKVETPYDAVNNAKITATYTKSVDETYQG